MVPSKGARMRFFASSALSCATVALERASCAARRSYSLLEMAWRPTRLRPRSNSTWARPRSASAVCRVAVSTAFSSCSIGWPARTFCPEVNSSSRTVPETSAVKVTPWLARSVPMAGRRLCHSRCSAAAAVTLTGGRGALNWAICFWMEINLAPASAATMTATTPSMISMRRNIVLFLGTCPANLRRTRSALPGNPASTAESGSEAVGLCPVAGQKSAH